jgi:hypothetical protein
MRFRVIYFTFGDNGQKIKSFYQNATNSVNSQKESIRKYRDRHNSRKTQATCLNNKHKFMTIYQISNGFE